MDLYKKIKEKAYIVAKISANHAGSLERAKKHSIGKDLKG